MPLRGKELPAQSIFEQWIMINTTAVYVIYLETAHLKVLASSLPPRGHDVLHIVRSTKVVGWGLKSFYYDTDDPTPESQRRMTRF